MKLTTILSNEAVYSWGGHEKDIARKVILISTCVIENIDSVMKETLMDAADNCVSVEFLLLEQQSSHLGDLSENISNFMRHISDLENCSFHAYLPVADVLCGLVKQWLQELKDDMDEPLHARFIFKSNLFGSLNLISCNLSASSNQIVDEFSPCQTCRCHGIPLDDALGRPIKSSTCPVTGTDLGTFDLDENSVKVGEHTILFLPSFQNYVKLQRINQPVDLIVIERTNLGSLSEGLILGASFIATPAVFHESDDMDKSELNTQLFQGLCSALHSLDQGLVCFSKCNIETMRESLFQCYYLLLPSEKGLMLLRRLAGLEEVLPFPDASQLMGSSATREIKNSIQDSLLKMEVREYNPFLHERGFHQKLNLLVKESLQLGSICPSLKEVAAEPNSTQRYDSSEEAFVGSKPRGNAVVIEDEIPRLDLTPGDEDQDSACITDEWENLIICEAPKISSPSCIFKPKFDKLVLSPQDGCKQLDDKTSRILERLEVPRGLKRKAPLAPAKAPLIPFQPTRGTDQGTTSSQPMKPNFQRIKRRQR